MMGDLGHSGGLKTLQMVISLSAGKAASGRFWLLARRGCLGMFRSGLPLLMGQKGPFVSETDLPRLVCAH